MAGHGHEPQTAHSILDQSAITDDSELRTVNLFFGEAMNGPGAALHDKHLQTLLKMIDTILILVQNDFGGAPGSNVTPGQQLEKDCQTDIDGCLD